MTRPGSERVHTGRDTARERARAYGPKAIMDPARPGSELMRTALEQARTTAREQARARGSGAIPCRSKLAHAARPVRSWSELMRTFRKRPGSGPGASFQAVHSPGAAWERAYAHGPGAADSKHCPGASSCAQPGSERVRTRLWSETLEKRMYELPCSSHGNGHLQMQSVEKIWL